MSGSQLKAAFKAPKLAFGATLNKALRLAVDELAGFSKYATSPSLLPLSLAALLGFLGIVPPLLSFLRGYDVRRTID